MSSPEPDITIIDDGSVVVFTPITDKAADFMNGAFAEAQTFGDGYVVEQRYVNAIMEDLADRGFSFEFR